MAGIPVDKKKQLRTIAVVSAVLIIVLIAYLLVFSRKPQGNKNDESIRTVVVVKDSIPAYAQIKSDMLEEKKVPATEQNANAVQSIKDVEGAYTLVAMVPGEPILKNHVSKADQNGMGSGLGIKLDEGTRAMTLKVDDVSGIAGLLKVGNRVDIMFAISADKSSTSGSTTNEVKNDTTAVYLVQNVPILALNKNLTSESKPSEGSSTASSSTNISTYSVVTLQLTTDQAQQITAAMSSSGKLYLALRPQDAGDATVHTAPISTSDLIIK
ncbi:MAG: Flp pilus assembly protein CpaB [Atopobium sp.]|uniref:Flp pilus assembly protein CpaB n=1 Tax=Atopobium sp. TaxID=1872650 RepID=UPI002A752C53|nr:Flp pilus assembly protein CpaB [Atopobium sp.]MDY2789040.1 Flp pilus assembly protein CpaB [Atopobium sp.]